MALNDSVANQMLADAIQTINLSGDGAVGSFPVSNAITQSAMMAHVLPVAPAHSGDLETRTAFRSHTDRSSSLGSGTGKQGALC